jgi:hypothetical protein
MTVRKATLGALLLATTPLIATPPAHAATPKAGCCEAFVMWNGALGEVAVLPKRGKLKGSVPPDWPPFNTTGHQYLPRNKKLRLVGILGADSTSKRSRGRYRFKLECMKPQSFTRVTKWTWVNVPGGPSKDPAAPVLPVKYVYGSLNTGNCTRGFVWFSYDQGDPNYGLSTNQLFTTARKRALPRQTTVWKWVTSGQAKTVRRTGKYPVPKGTLVGQYFYNSRAYAMKVRGQFRGYKLVRGTLLSSDLMFWYTENKRTDTGIVGGFFDKKLSQPKRTFKVVG